MKKTNKILSVFLALLMVISIIPMASITVSAATFADINQSNVFLKQAEGSVTCTLVASTMMVRRAAMMNGNSNWASITESSMKSTAWTDSGGLWYNFTYAGISVKHSSLPGGSSNTATLISLLNQHPEGIVLYKNTYPTHAVLLTDYTNGVFYCADPGYGTPTGRIPISSAAYVTINNAAEYWYVSSPKCTLTTNVPTTGISLNSTSFSLEAGQTKDLTATVTPSNATDKSVTWSSSNTNVAIVSSSGVVLAKAGGTCIITATNSGGQKATATVNVTSGSLKICVDGSSNNQYWNLTLGETESTNCYLSINEYYGNSVEYSYAVSNNNVSCSLGNADSSNQAPFSIYADRVGETEIKITVKDATSGAVLDTINVYVTVDSKTYTVTFDANGGTGAPASQTKTHGTTLTLSTAKPTRTGYTFLGWSTSSTATSATYSSGGSFTANANTTLYAVWQKDEPQVYVEGNYFTLMLGAVSTCDVMVWTNVEKGYEIYYKIADPSIVSCSWGTWNSENKIPLTITAKSKGKTTIDIQLKDKATGELVHYETLHINVAIVDSYINFSIKEPSTTTIRHNDGIILHLNAEGNIPDGAKILWTVDNNNFDGGYSEDGMQCLLISKNNGYTVITVILYDANDNVIATDSIEMRSKAGFFDKIGGFFRNLFGTTKIYEY